MRSSRISPDAMLIVSTCSVYVPAADTSNNVSAVPTTATVFVPDPAAVTVTYTHPPTSNNTPVSFANPVCANVTVVPLIVGKPFDCDVKLEKIAVCSFENHVPTSNVS